MKIEATLERIKAVVGPRAGSPIPTSRNPISWRRGVPCTLRLDRRAPISR